MMVDNLDLAEEYIHQNDITYERAIAGKHCCDCRNYDPCPWNDEYGICVLEDFKSKSCSKCGKSTYYTSTSYYWTLGNELITELGCDVARI